MTYAPELAEGIRRYGPGKFNLMVDSWLYNLAGDSSWLDEEFTPYEDQWYGLIVGSITEHSPAAPTENWFSLTVEEWRLLQDSAGYILSENSDGFVDVRYYETKEELALDWYNLLATYEDVDNEVYNR